ncbi:hypothetical protein Eta_008 [Serratia phage Eta]|uniref:VRR-NUC domain-containing protein n=1 Tax=Serratia phage Eta TaxID=1282995 RepID=R9W0W0_9CAUD|nr:hypothetical protein Eta_008 [Serratia phage Eta]AGN89454.1 hypothetical protein Eta_008 [Serratia phage Eta]
MNLKSIPNYIPIFGDVNYRGECATETAELIGFFRLLEREFPSLAAIATHIRNEGKRSKFQGYKQQQEGMNTGASDIIIPCSPPIVIELKRRDHTLSAISAKQVSYLSSAQVLGAFSVVALGAVGAMEAVKAWHTANKK